MDKFREKFRKPLNKYSKVKKVIGVVSGKGGVGKSLVTTSLAVAMNRAGYKTAIMDADITGPSIPKAFGIEGQTYQNQKGILPRTSKTGIKIMSLNLLVENPGDPVIWRGPILADMVTQFGTDVFWDDVDYMFVDLPPGTGDIPLTVFQALPVDGIVVVTSPQELVKMIVEKSVKMANEMDIPVLGLVENMSYYVCPDCGKKHEIFGPSHIEEVAKEFSIDTFAKLPIDPSIAQSIDAGNAEAMKIEHLDPIISKIQNL